MLFMEFRAELESPETEFKAELAAWGIVSVAKSETEFKAEFAALLSVLVVKFETEFKAEVAFVPMFFNMFPWGRGVLFIPNSKYP